MNSRVFQSALGEHFERFIAIKRAGGAAYDAQARLLRRFDRHLQEHWSGESPLTATEMQTYLDSLTGCTPTSRRNPASIAWRAVAYALRHGGPVESLPPRPIFPNRRARDPHVLAPEEIRRLLDACRRLRPAGSLRPFTCETLFGLLYTTGMRISEALALDASDLDREDQSLLVRAGKFGKDRLLPIKASTVKAIVVYLESPLRDESTAVSSPLFVSHCGGRLTYQAALGSYRRAVTSSGVRDHAGSLPRIHDLRYTFAAHRLAAWYRAGRDVDGLLSALSTYLGHDDVAHTLVYLRPAAALMDEASTRFEGACLPSGLRGL